MKKILLDFEVDVKTIDLVSQILKKVSLLESDLTENQKTLLSNFALNLLFTKNKQVGHSKVSPISETLFNFLGARIVEVDKE